MSPASRKGDGTCPACPRYLMSPNVLSQVRRWLVTRFGRQPTWEALELERDPDTSHIVPPCATPKMSTSNWMPTPAFANLTMFWPKMQGFQVEVVKWWGQLQTFPKQTAVKFGFMLHKTDGLTSLSACICKICVNAKFEYMLCRKTCKCE